MRNPLAATLALSIVCVGCADIELQDPHSARYSEVGIAVGDGSNGGVPGRYLIDVQDVETAMEAIVEGNHAAYRHMYLAPGDYALNANCLRAWPEPGHTLPPYGLRPDHPAERFEITVERHRKYILDCTPGLEGSKFFLREAE